MQEGDPGITKLKLAAWTHIHYPGNEHSNRDSLVDSRGEWRCTDLALHIRVLRSFSSDYFRDLIIREYLPYEYLQAGIVSRFPYIHLF
jgi:hypothetical protein